MLIGLCGQAGAGKSTVAGILEARGFVRHRFAGPLKNMLRAVGLTEREIEGDDKELPCAMLAGATPRKAMQTLGTEWGRGLHPDLWVSLWAHRIPEGDVVAEDVRFENEAAAIVNAGGWIVRVHRAGLPAPMPHISEAGVAWDDQIDNNGPLDKLPGLVLSMLGRRLWAPDDRNARLLRYA